MKKFLGVFTILIALLLAVTLCACGGNTGGGSGTQGGNQPSGSGGADETWRTISGSQAEPSEVYKNLVNGLNGTLADVSTSKLNSSNPICSIDSTISLAISQDGTTKNLTLTVKGNFNIASKSENKISCEISNSSNELVIGAYYFDGKCYVTFGETEKLAIEVETSIINDLLPLDLSSSKPVNDIVKILDSIIAVQSKGVSGRYRQNGSNYEYDYNVDIDLTGSISKLKKALNEGTEIKNLDRETIRMMIKSVTGIDMEYMNGAPASVVKLAFSTVAKKVTAFSADIHFAKSTDTKTVFYGKETDIKIDFSELTVDTKFTGMPFFADYSYQNDEYQDYLTKGYGAEINVKKEGIDFNDPAKNIPESFYKIKLEAKVDDEVSENNKILIEVSDIETGEDKSFGIYIYGGKAYVYSKPKTGGDYALVTSCNIDVIDVVNRLKHGESQVSEKADTLVSIAYIMSALKINNDDINIRITEDFYSTVWKGFSGIVAYIDQAATDIDLEEVLDNNDINIVEYMTGNNFDFEIPLKKNIEGFNLYIVEEIEFPVLAE